MGPSLGGAVPYVLCLEGPVHEDGLGDPRGGPWGEGGGWDHGQVLGCFGNFHREFH